MPSPVLTDYLDSYSYAPKLRDVSSAIAETVETANVAELEQEEWPDVVPDLIQEEWPHAFVDLEVVADFEEESAHTFMDLEERESADSMADFKEESADAVSVEFER